jgi:hypothetical protein
MRWLLLIILCAVPAFATQPTCTPGTSGGTTLVCPNISTDTTLPSGQTYSRWIAFVVYPQGQQASNSLCIIVLGPGKGWVESAATQNIFTGQATLARALALFTTPACPGGFAVYAFYTTWAAAGQVVSAHNIGDMSFIVEPIGNVSGQIWWPNLTPGTFGACNLDGGCLGINPPFNVVYGNQAASPSNDQETLTVTSQSGTGSTNNLTVGMQKAHAANEYVYITKTQFPANVADYAAHFNWIGANAGQGTFPGNPQKIYVSQISSDSHGGLMVALLPHGECLASCSVLNSWWGPIVGNNGGSSQSASSWKVLGIVDIGVPWSLPYMFSNGSSGGGNPGAVQSVLTSLMGCRSTVETGCPAALTVASPLTYLPTTTYTGPIITATGTFDVTTPCDLYPQTLPSLCSANNMYAQSGRDYVQFAGGGSGHGGDGNGVQNAVTFTGTSTAGSSTILVSNTTGLLGGIPNAMTLGGPGIPFNTIIGAVMANTSITLVNSSNSPVNATQSGTFSFTGAGQSWQLITNALNGFPGGSSYLSGTATIGGTAGSR